MLYVWSIIAGIITGFAVCVGAARMFKAPEVQGMGSFRTLGEINACNGDAISHFSFGLGFLLNSAATAAATGALTQDVHHRVIPNWAAAIVTFRKKKDKIKLLSKPTRMGLVGAILGAIIMPLLMGINQVIPSEISDVAAKVLQPAATWLFSYIMPVIFLLAAIGAGKYQAIFAILFGVLSQFISGNALPGIVLGILAGSITSQLGINSYKSWIVIGFVLIMFILIFYFRNMDPNTGWFKPETWDGFFKLKVLI